MVLLTAKSSTIFIASGKEDTKIFHSVDEVPPELRVRLHETTRGLNSATILIADKRGREELVRALQGRPSHVQCRLAETMRSRQGEKTVAPPKRIRLGSLRSWLEFLVPVIVGAALWLFVESKF